MPVAAFPKALLPARLSVPAVTPTLPVNAFAPDNTNVPAPAFTRSPFAMASLIVAVWAAEVTVMLLPVESEKRLSLFASAML